MSIGIKVWLSVLIYGLLAQGCGHIAGGIAQVRGKDPDPAFYGVLLISIIILALAANGLVIIRLALQIIVALMGRGINQ